MRISDLVQKTGVPKETIHFYIREGLLRKPRKSGARAAVYTQGHLERILLIKELRESYFLPIPEIKKILRQSRRQTASDQAVADFHNKYFRPLDRLLATEIVGREAFCEATGLGRRWLATMEAWGIITYHEKEGQPVYSRDDLIIGRLVVDMDRLGFGPKDGYDPEELKRIADFIRNFVRSAHRGYYQRNLERLSSADLDERGSKFTEIMSLFFYHIYRKLVREEYRELRNASRPACAAAGRPVRRSGVRAEEAHEACADDVQRLCKDVKPGEGRIVRCLRDNSASLSNECRDKLMEAKKRPK